MPAATETRARPLAAQIMLVVGASCLLLFPVSAWLGHWSEGRNIEEKRALAPLPDWRALPTHEWMPRAESWLNDHFPQRSRFVWWNSYFRQRLLQAPTLQVVVGRDGWLFYAGDNTVEDLLGRDRLSAEELARWRNALAGRQAWLRARGIAYLFIIAPNKSTIYPEYLPSLLRVGARPGKLDQLVTELRTHGVPVLDLRPALRAAKSQQLLYWPWDSHWNGHAHLLACRELLASLRTGGGREVGTTDAASWIRVVAEERAFDCVDLLGMRGHWPAAPVPQLRLTHPPDWREAQSQLSTLAPWKDFPAWRRVIVTERDSGQGRVVMFCDSFFRAGGIPLDALGDLPLSLEFRRFISIWDTMTYDSLLAVAELEKPDVVIEEYTERFLRAILPQEHPEWQKAREASSANRPPDVP